MAAAPDEAEKLEQELQNAGLPARIVGTITEPGEIEIFVSGVNGLIFEVRNRSGIKKASICMSLDGMKKDPNLVYKLRIQGEYIKADQCKIKITDLGFGQIRQASYQTWQQVIQLERGDYHE